MCFMQALEQRSHSSELHGEICLAHLCHVSQSGWQTIQYACDASTSTVPLGGSTTIHDMLVDFTGALFYKSVHQKHNKAYICLFTCAVARAIHLEVVTDMTTDSFLRAFRRFAGRRSLPSHMVSDNECTFIAAVEEIRELFKDPSVNNYLTKKGVQWTFIPKRAPWFGGFYERLIGITRNTLKKTLGRSLVNLDELNTIVIEIESVINDRPITYISTYIGEFDPLSPSMLMYGHQLHRYLINPFLRRNWMIQTTGWTGQCYRNDQNYWTTVTRTMLAKVEKLISPISERSSHAKSQENRTIS